MSLEAAAAFYERLENEKDLMERIKVLQTPENIERFVKGELGYDFTRGEIQQVVFERNPEMTDEELEAVTGGCIGAFLMMCLVYAAGYAALAAA